MARYRELEVAGAPRELGRQIGEALRDEIREFAATALALVRKTVRISDATVQATLASSLRLAADYAPDHVEELRGMADATGLPLDALMLLQTRNQMLPEADAGCTSVALGAGDESPGAWRVGGLVAQNWDNDPALDRFTIVLTRRPTGKPALLNVTQAGLIAYIGFNSAGLGLCLNTLPAPARRTGVPHYFTVRGIYEARSLDEAVQAVRRAERAIPANIMLTTPQGPADLEVTIDDVHVLRDDANRRVTHANHCRHPALQAVAAQFGDLIQSRERQRRVDDLLDACGAPPTVADVQRILRDHEGYPRSLCRHPNDDPATGFWETVFSVILEPGERRMHLSRGTPCTHEYDVYELRAAD